MWPGIHVPPEGIGKGTKFGAFLEIFAAQGNPGRAYLSQCGDWLYLFNIGDYYWFCLGVLCMGVLLELGSKGNVVSHNMAYLRCNASFQIPPGLERQEDGFNEHYRLCLRALYLFRS